MRVTFVTPSEHVGFVPFGVRVVVVRIGRYIRDVMYSGCLR